MFSGSIDTGDFFGGGPRGAEPTVFPVVATCFVPLDNSLVLGEVVGPAARDADITVIPVLTSSVRGASPRAADTPATVASMDPPNDTFDVALIVGYPFVLSLFYSDTGGGPNAPVMGVLVDSAYTNSDKCMAVEVARGDRDGDRGVFFAEGELTRH